MEGGSASVIGGPVVTPLTAITSRAGQGVTVTHADGTLGVVPLTVIPADVLTPSSGPVPGLLGTYYATMDLSGSPVAAFVSPTIDSLSVLAPGCVFGAMDRNAHAADRPAPSVLGPPRRGRAALLDGRLVASGDSRDSRSSSRARRRSRRKARRRSTPEVPVPIVIEYSVELLVRRRAPALGWQPPPPRCSPTPWRPRAPPTRDRVRERRHVRGHGSHLAVASGRPGPARRGGGGGESADDRRPAHAGPVLMPWLADVAG